MIVRLAADGVVVQEADDCGGLRLATDLDTDGAQTALSTTGTGTLIDPDTAWLELGVLRSRAQLVATSPDWAQQWAALVTDAEGRGTLSEDGRSVRVPIER